MTMCRFCPVVVFFIAFALVPGCGRSNRPAGLPKLYPCRITILQDGQPLSGAAVQLAGGESDKWPATGLTDVNGTAVMVTYGRFQGAPAGDYRVVVKKTVEQIQKPGDNDQGSSADIYSLVEIKYADPEKTDLEIHIVQGKNVKTFEVGKEARVLVDSIRPGT